MRAPTANLCLMDTPWVVGGAWGHKWLPSGGLLKASAKKWKVRRLWINKLHTVDINFINFNRNYSALTVIRRLDFVKLPGSLFSPGIVYSSSRNWINKHVDGQILGRAKRSLFSLPCKYLSESKYSLGNFFSPGKTQVHCWIVWNAEKPVLTRMSLKIRRPTNRQTAKINNKALAHQDSLSLFWRKMHS